jgi:hypothetical protein
MVDQLEIGSVVVRAHSRSESKRPNGYYEVVDDERDSGVEQYATGPPSF